MVTLSISLADGTVAIEADPDQIEEVTASAIKLIEALSATQHHAATRQVKLTATESNEKTKKSEAIVPAETELEIKAKARTKKGTVKSKNWQHFPGLLSHDGWNEVKNFYDEKMPSGQNEQVAVFVAKLSKILDRKGFDGNEIHSAFKSLGIKTPANLMGVLGNMASLGLGHTSDGKFQLDFKGQQLVDIELPRSKAAKR